MRTVSLNLQVIHTRLTAVRAGRKVSN